MRTVQPTSQSRGVALVIVLAFIALLTILVTAFFSRAILDRQVADASVAQMKADQLARTALEVIAGDLKQEMNAGSKADGDPSGATYTANGTRIYVPKTNKSVVPARIGTHDNLPNLVRRSVRSASGSPEEFPSQSTVFNSTDYLAALLPKNRASAVSSIDPSQNGRAISRERWNKPLLLSGGTVPTEFTAPDWVILTRGGPKVFTAWNAALKDSALSNQDYAVGRYTYTVYDEGGLIDINLAGYPSSLSGDNDFQGRKGRMAQTTLSNITGVSDGPALVAWRNALTATSAATYRDYALNATPKNPGFLSVMPGDQSFLSRQDLLNYQKNNPTVLTSDAMPFLGTFSREVNGPTFTPDPARAKVLSGGTYHPEPGWNSDLLRGISLNAGDPETFGDDDNYNPSLLNTRGSTGRPLIAQRFPLSRLAMLTPIGPAPGVTAAEVKAYFGLVWDNSSDQWIYTSPEGTGTTPATVIKYLKNVPNSRAPDFFETLQAAIGIGSLGRDSDGMQYYKPDYEPGTSSTSRVESRIAYYHIMQIGANIIDQADLDSYPTGISFRADIVSGVEDLPYPLRIFNRIYRDPIDPSKVFAAYDFELWNPHQNLSAPGPAPGSFRISGSGAAYLRVGNATNTVDAAPVDISTSPPVLFSVSSPANFRAPVRIGGFAMGSVSVPQNYVALIWGSPSCTFSMQYLGPSGKWREYQKFRRLQWQIKESFFSGVSYAEWFNMRVDPRTDRFGTSMNYLPGDNNFGASAPIGSTIRPDASAGFRLGENSPFAAGIFTYSGGQNSISGAQNSFMGMLSENTASSPVYYKDPDNVVRPADGAFRSGTDGQPLATGNFPSRPVILNRPFRSVAELGYVYRDLPFKSLDFFTDTSGDAALLDAFSVDDASVVAGQVNINTRQPVVLAALLTGSAKMEDTPSNAISSAEALILATDLVNLTKATPILNRSELVTRFGPLVTYSTSTNGRIKAQREAAVRALAETSNTRTWNLLIDVVGQSGRYLPSSSTLANFAVDGERRYWLHLAIDRFTGEVVEQRLESVYE